ncbi:DUF6491 family protein [Sphingomonas sp.]|uniref:DUF6491 family protein n=1 Tax=Sphingomonas sp. TaxID=28214 RepID=UPI003CC6BF12
MRPLILTAFALSSVAAAPHRAPADASGIETTIPLLAPERIRDFEPDGDRAVYVQDMRFRWYRVELNRPCRPLPFVTTIAVRSRFTYALDRSDDVIADGERCAIERITTSAAPVREHRRHGRS